MVTITRRIERRTASGILVAAGLMAASLTSQAFELDAEIRAGYGFTDNVTRSPDVTIEERLQTAGLTLELEQHSRKLDLILNSSFEFLHFEYDTFDDDLVGGLVANATYWFIEDRFNWVLQENFGQQLFDPFAAETVDNRENLNYITTGPGVILPLGVRNFFGVDLRYSAVDYEIQDLDNRRTGGRIYYGRYLSESSQLTVNYRNQQVEYDPGSAGTDFDVNEFFFRYELDDTRNRIAVDVGYSMAEIPGDEGDGSLLSFVWERRMSSRSTLEVSAGSRYSDQGDLFRFIQDGTDDIDLTLDVNSFDVPFRNNTASVGYQLNADRTRFRIGMNWIEEDSEFGSSVDRDEIITAFDVSREFTRRVSISLGATFSDRDYKYVDRKDEDIDVGVVLSVQLSPSWRTELDLQYSDRQSNVPDSDYTENRAYLILAYAPFSRTNR